MVYAASIEHCIFTIDKNRNSVYSFLYVVIDLLGAELACDKAVNILLKSLATISYFYYFLNVRYTETKNRYYIRNILFYLNLIYYLSKHLRNIPAIAYLLLELEVIFKTLHMLAILPIYTVNTR